MIIQNHMRTIAFILAVLCSMPFARAQQSDPAQQKAEDVLRQVSAKYSAYKTLRVEFNFTVENNKEGTTDEEKGTVWLKGDQYKVDLMGVETISDGKNVWSYQKKSNEVNISEKDPADKSFFNNPSMIFTNYQNNFKYLYKGENKEGDKTYCDVDLFPKELDKDVIKKGPGKTSYSRIRLNIDKTDYRIMSIRFFGKDGDNYTIELTRVGPNLNLEPDFFTFNPAKHPGIEIIDLR